MPEKEKADKKALILDAAREIFLEKGYYPTTSEEIARRAGVGKGTIYQYFESKKEIFLEMQIGYMDAYSKNISTCIHADASLQENIHSLVRSHLDHIDILVKYHKTILNDFPKVMTQHELKDPRLQEIKAKMEYTFAGMVDQAIAQGEMRPLSQPAVIYLISGLFMGLAHYLMSEEANLDQMKMKREQLEEEIVMLILHGISL